MFISAKVTPSKASGEVARSHVGFSRDEREKIPSFTSQTDRDAIYNDLNNNPSEIENADVRPSGRHLQNYKMSEQNYHSDYPQQIREQTNETEEPTPHHINSGCGKSHSSIEYTQKHGNLLLDAASKQERKDQTIYSKNEEQKLLEEDEDPYDEAEFAEDPQAQLHLKNIQSKNVLESQTQRSIQHDEAFVQEDEENEEHYYDDDDDYLDVEENTEEQEEYEVEDSQNFSVDQEPSHHSLARGTPLNGSRNKKTRAVTFNPDHKHNDLDSNDESIGGHTTVRAQTVPIALNRQTFGNPLSQKAKLLDNKQAQPKNALGYREQNSKSFAEDSSKKQLEPSSHLRKSEGHQQNKGTQNHLYPRFTTEEGEFTNESPVKLDFSRNLQRPQSYSDDESIKQEFFSPKSHAQSVFGKEFAVINSKLAESDYARSQPNIEKQNLTAQIKELNNDKQNLLKEVDNSRHKNKTLQEKNVSLQRQVDELRNQKESYMNEQILKEDQAIEKIEQLNSDLSERFSTLQHVHSVAENELTRLRNVIVRLEGESTASIARETDLKKLLGEREKESEQQIVSKLEEAHQERSSLEDKLKELEQNYRAVVRENDQLQGTNQLLADQIDENNQTIEKLQADIEALNVVCREQEILQNRIDELEQLHQSSIDQLKETQKSSDQKVADLQEKNIEIFGLRDIVDALNEHKGELLRQVDLLQARLHQTEKSKSSSCTQLVENQNETKVEEQVEVNKNSRNQTASKHKHHRELSKDSNQIGKVGQQIVLDQKFLAAVQKWPGKRTFKTIHGDSASLPELAAQSQMSARERYFCQVALEEKADQQAQHRVDDQGNKYHPCI